MKTVVTYVKTVATLNVDNMLSTDQQEALDKLVEFVNQNRKTEFLLIGKPGCGKTFLIKEFIKTVNKSNYTLCAPTHKAASILRAGINIEVQTIHQLLKLSPNIDIIDLDLRNLSFSSGGELSLLTNHVIICDEASMINDDLYDHLTSHCRATNSKIIFICDKKQLQPVKLNRLSKVFTIDNFFELTHNHRQSNSSLTEVIENSRDNVQHDFSKYEGESVRIFTSAKEMLNLAIDNFKMQSMLEYTQFSKILTYTNDRVEKFNKYIHKNITDDEYCFNELLTGYGNSKTILNSEDYLVKSVTSTLKLIPYTKITMWGFNLTLKRLTSGELEDVFVLPRNTGEDTKYKLAIALEELRLDASRRKNLSLWRKYYDLDRSFLAPFNLELGNRLIKQKGLDYGYAQSIHKS